MDEQFWRNAPKAYCDNANIAVSRGDIGDMFMLAMLSGGSAQVFAFTPEHIKRVSQLINHNIDLYEKEVGPIEVEAWSPNVKSPVQIKDFDNGKGTSNS